MSEERMNREIQQNTTTMKKLRFLRGAHANESQYSHSIEICAPRKDW